MRVAFYVFLCLLLAACGAAPHSTELFDLATFNTDINRTERLGQASKAQTLLGFEAYQSQDAALLRYHGLILAGTNGKNHNQLLLHYPDGQNHIAFFELKLYTAPQISALIKELEKMGPGKTSTNQGMDLDENGNTKQASPAGLPILRSWEDKTRGLSYFLQQQDNMAELTVLDPESKPGRDWIAFRAFQLP